MTLAFNALLPFQSIYYDIYSTTYKTGQVTSKGFTQQIKIFIL